MVVAFVGHGLEMTQLFVDTFWKFRRRFIQATKKTIADYFHVEFIEMHSRAMRHRAMTQSKSHHLSLSPSPLISYNSKCLLSFVRTKINKNYFRFSSSEIFATAFAC